MSLAIKELMSHSTAVWIDKQLKQQQSTGVKGALFYKQLTTGSSDKSARAANFKSTQPLGLNNTITKCLT